MANLKSGSASKSVPNVAVILAGCGRFDGSEVHEAVFVLSHLTRNGVQPKLFAPDIAQWDVFDHLEKKEEAANRNVLIESARLSLGEIAPITNLVSDVENYHALVIPGGYGVGKNLCDFSLKGADMTVQKDVATVIKAFHKAKKPIGLVCVAPVLAAKLIPGVTITLGKYSRDEWPYCDSIEAAKKMGAKMEEKGVDEFAVDSINNVYSTPAFFYGPAKFHEVDDGIGNMVKAIVKSL